MKCVSAEVDSIHNTHDIKEASFGHGGCRCRSLKQEGTYVTLEQRKPERSSVTTAAALLVWGLLCFVAPFYFQVTGDKRVAWFWFGVFLAALGAGMAFSALANLPGREARIDIGAPFFVGILTAAAATSPYKWHFYSPWNGMIKATGFVFAFLTVILVAEAINKLLSAEARTARAKSARSITERVLAAVIASCGQATAALNLVAALNWKK